MADPAYQVTGPLGSLDKFEGANYQLWRCRAEAALEERNCLAVVLGAETRPVAADAANPTDAEKKKISDWDVREIRGKNILIRGLADNQLRNVTRLKTSSEIWASLENTHKLSGMTARIKLGKTLMTTIYQDGMSIEAYTSHYANLLAEADAVGFTLPNDTMITLLMLSLPVEYKPILTWLDQKDVNSWKWNEVVEALLKDEFNTKIMTSRESIAESSAYAHKQ